ncbi:MAG TPA: sulfotransferase [Candidatus Sulfotelmatobacter sp.]|nr:sulfotransferase [Candidatus Sulfotelmatobacter sp.]
MTDAVGTGRPLPSRKVARSIEKADAFRTRGQLDAAVAIYRSVLRSLPDHFGALYGLAIARAQQGKLDDGVILLRQAVALDPTHVEAQNNLGGMLHALGRMEEACRAFEAAAAANPGDADLQNNLGVLNAVLGRHAAAAACFERALALRPQFAAALNNLGKALQTLGRDGAAECFERAIALRPDFAEAFTNLGLLRLVQGRHDSAIAGFERALAIRPDYAEAHNNLGLTRLSLEHPREALPCFERAITIRPNLADAHSNMGTALAALRRQDDAIACYQRALAIDPNHGAAWANLGNAWMSRRREAEATACYERALASPSRDPDTYCSVASNLQALGRLEDAQRAAEAAIALSPGRPDLYHVLARIKRFAANDAHTARMEALAQNMSSFGEGVQASLHFALAKVYDDTADHDRSFQHAATANALKRRTIAYDETKTLGFLERVSIVFSADLMKRHRGSGAASPVPVFIVGMPRSGTTLVEQILASHASVFGAGELEDFPAAASRLTRPDGRPLALPDDANELSAGQLRELGMDYLERIRPSALGAARVTDKLPFNFFNVGLIHLALPDARIVHVRRDPVDTCLSCFSTNFAGNRQPFSYELGELGRYYRAYEAVMEHWRAVLPAGVMLDVNYEDVVDDLEGQARRLVAHCGLAWDPACLAFHAAKRPVRTASAVQVRQPIYRSSVARWRPYAHLLTPLFDALGVDRTTIA